MLVCRNMFVKMGRALRHTLTEHWITILILLVVLAFSLLLHVKLCDTSIVRHNEARFVKMVEAHQTGYPFSIRYMTTVSIMLLAALGLTVKQSFFLLQYALAAVLGLSFYRYLLSLGFAKSRANAGLFFLLSAYPVLAAHIEPVHTWDDFWAHLFAVLSFTALIKAKPIQGIVWFTLACFAREQSLIFLPVLVFAAARFNPRLSALNLVILAAAPVILYGAFYAYNWQTPKPKRFELILFNFETPLRTSDTLFSVFVSFGFMWLTSLIGVVRRAGSLTPQLLRWGTTIMLPATVIFALFLTNARETRILFPPFLFVIPICVCVLDEVYLRLKSKIRPSGLFSGAIVAAVLMAVGVVMGHLAFPAFEYRRCEPFQRLWAGIQFGLILNLMAYTLRWGWRRFALGTGQAKTNIKTG
jgi:hypothetical protein